MILITMQQTTTIKTITPSPPNNHNHNTITNNSFRTPTQSKTSIIIQKIKQTTTKKSKKVPII